MSVDPTSVSYESFGYTVGQSPVNLQVPYRFHSDNAAIPSKGVAGVGPQAGNQSVFRNLGSVIIPGIQRYLQLGGQNPTGIQPRVVATVPNELWDAPYTLNPSIEVV